MNVNTNICNICFEDTPLLEVSLHENNPCNSFKCCESCAFTFLSHKIKEKNVISFKCPGCVEPLLPNDVHKILNSISNTPNLMVPSKIPNLLMEYDEAMKSQSLLETNRDKRLQRSFPSLSETFDDFAFNCWKINSDTRKCPGCRCLIEKNGGCQHMTCWSCRHQFWWCCGQNYNRRHYEALCLPIVFANDPHPYWGPNILVRFVTKTVVGSLGISIAPVAAVVVVGVIIPVVYLGEKINKTRQDMINRQRDSQRLKKLENIRLVSSQVNKYQISDHSSESLDRFSNSRRLLHEEYKKRKIEEASSIISLPETTSRGRHEERLMLHGGANEYHQDDDDEEEYYIGYLPLKNRWDHQLMVNELKNTSHPVVTSYSNLYL